MGDSILCSHSAKHRIEFISGKQTGSVRKMPSTAQQYAHCSCPFLYQYLKQCPVSIQPFEPVIRTPDPSQIQRANESIRPSKFTSDHYARNERNCNTLQRNGLRAKKALLSRAKVQVKGCIRSCPVHVGLRRSLYFFHSSERMRIHYNRAAKVQSD